MGTAGKQRLLRVVSKCSTVEDFVAAFRKFCDGESLFIVTRAPKPLGTVQPISINLADGKPVLAGIGRVVESFADGGGPGRRSGMRVAFDRLDEEGRALLERMGPPAIITSSPPEDPMEDQFSRVVTNIVSRDDAPAAKGEAPAEDEEDTVMPANPLGTLSDETLASFVECTLYEESGLVELPNDDELRAASEADERAGLPAWWPREERTPLPPLAPTESSESASLAPAESARSVAPSAGGVAMPVNGIPAGLPIRAPATTTPPPMPQAAPPPIPPAVPAHTPPPMPRAQPPQGYADTAAVLLPVQQRPWQRPTAIAAGAAIGGLLFGYLIWGGGDEDVDATPPPDPAALLASTGLFGDESDETPTPAPGEGGARQARAVPPERTGARDAQGLEAKEPEPVLDVGTGQGADARDDDAADEPDEPDEPGEDVDSFAGDDGFGGVQAPATVAAVAGGDCQLTIATSSDLARVIVDGTDIGATPFSDRVPCGTRTVVVDHPRYQKVQRTVELSPGADKRLDLDLVRPQHKLVIVSLPAGATVTVQGRKVGKTPLITKVIGYEKAQVVVSRPGYKPWSERVYSRRSTQRVSAKLERQRRRPTARTKRRGARGRTTKKK